MNGREEIRPESWVEEYGNFLVRYAYSRVNNQQVAEDLVQDTFLAAVKSIDSFEGKSSVKTWLVAILRRKIIDFYRKRAVRSEEELPEMPFRNDGAAKGHWEPQYAPQDWKGNPEDAFRQKEFMQVLQDCLDHLPEKGKLVFMMKELEHIDTETICKELEISSSNYWVLMHRARLLLRACLEKNWFTNKDGENHE